MTTNSHSVHLVFQRYRSCKILIDESEWTTQGWVAKDATVDAPTSSDLLECECDEPHCGLLIYISFASNADNLSCINAAETCLNLPILTSGLWGDGSSQLFSIKSQLAHVNHNGKANTSVTIVPQANLICKVKSQGSSIQYHNQIDKDKGRELYNLFVDYMSAAIIEYQYNAMAKETPEWLHEWRNHLHQQTKESPVSQSFDPSVAPVDMFRFVDPPVYGSFDDDTGLPLTDLMHEPLSKSSMKKLRKIQDLHHKRHQKWLHQNAPAVPTENQGTVSTDYCIADREDSFPPSVEPAEAIRLLNVDWKSKLDPSFCMIVAGTFGKRQGLEIQSDMGPFCHVVQI